MQMWTVRLEGGPRRVNHAAVVIGDDILMFGGYCTGENYRVTRPMDVHILNTVSYRWRALPIPPRKGKQHAECPYQRYGHTAVAWEDNGYIWGGRNDIDGACNVLFCFDSSTERWSRPDVIGDIPGARDGHSACVINARMFIFGGYEEKKDQFSNEVHVLDFSTFSWSLLRVKGRPARWRDFQSAAAIDSKMYIFGGRSDKAGPSHTSSELYCNNIQVFDTLTYSWHRPIVTGTTPVGRRSHSAFVYNGAMYIFGGYNGLHDVHFGDMFKFDPVTNHWSVVKVRGDGPCPRRRQCCCAMGHRVFIFGGTSPCLEPTENTEFDLMDLSDLHVLDFAPTLKTLCILMTLKHDLDPTYLPRDIRWEMKAMTTNSNISRPLARIASG